MKAGIILHKIQDSNIYIVDVGWGQLRHFSSNKNYKEESIVLYCDLNKPKLECGKYISYDLNEIEFICLFDDCKYIGNVNDNCYHLYDDYDANIIIAAKSNTFICWEDDYKQTGLCYHFDEISSSLLFLHYAERRYPFNEKDLLEAYNNAKEKVDELNIPKMIGEYKVEIHHNSWMRRGSDIVTFGTGEIRDSLSDRERDCYLDKIFPKYEKQLYKTIDGAYEYENPEFEGVDIDDFCANKTKELRLLAIKNYESYNKDEHILSLVYNHIYWSKIFDYENDYETLFKIIGRAELIWGFKYDDLCKNVNKYNYLDLIESNNARHQIPQFND